MGGSVLRLFQVDAFSSRAFGGNPAAVVLVDDSSQIDDATRQQVAAENNLGETAFVERHPESTTQGQDLFKDSADFSLRWFTPEVEVPLCGHATLAAAAVVYSECGNANLSVRFHTLSGPLVVSRKPASEIGHTTSGATTLSAGAPAASDDYNTAMGEGSCGQAAVAVADGGVAGDRQPLVLEMSLTLSDPLDPVPKGCNDPVLLATCVGSAKVQEVRYAGSNLKYLLIVLDDTANRSTLESMRPDMGAMAKCFGNKDVHAVIVTVQGATSHGGYDFLSRFFAPWMGIDEDHVTGSAHSVLGSYWQARLGKDVMLARQCSPRGGDLTVKIDRGTGRALISGTAVIVIRATIHL